jgi:hypothetical protein
MTYDIKNHSSQFDTDTSTFIEKEPIKIEVEYGVNKSIDVVPIGRFVRGGIYQVSIVC